MSSFDRLLNTIQALEQGNELTEGKLHQLLTLVERGEQLRHGAERVRSIGRRLWGLPLVEAVHEYRCARAEAEAIARTPEGEELKRRLVCTLHTRGTLVRLVEMAWQCRSRLPGKGVRLLRRAVQLADGLLPAEYLADLPYPDTPGHDYLMALWQPSAWRHPLEALTGQLQYPQGKGDASDPVTWVTVTPAPPQGPNIAPFRPVAQKPGADEQKTEREFLEGRTVARCEYQIHDQARTRAYLANALRTAGRRADAAEVWRQVDVLLQPEGWFLPPPDSLMGEVLSLRAALYQDTGDLGAAEETAVEARRLLLRAGDREGAAIQRVQLMAMSSAAPNRCDPAIGSGFQLS